MKKVYLERSRKAFTIIEVIVAIGVFTIGILGIEAFFATSSRLTTAASKMSTASNLAQGLIDDQMARSYEELITGTGSKTRISDDNTNPFYPYQQQITITYVNNDMTDAGTFSVGMKKINVKVFYQIGASEKTVELVAIKTRGAEPAP